MITIAGSGPSITQLDHVDVATKKRSIPSDYIFCRFMYNYHRFAKDDNSELMLYCKQCNCGKSDCYFCGVSAYYCDKKRWDKYYRKFTRSKVHQKMKPSTGLCAVFGVVERWKPKTIGLIGFDWVLDENPDWEHDAQAEKQAILSLTNIVDLRNGSNLCGVRSA